MQRRTRVSATKNGRKTQIPPPPRTPEQEAQVIAELTQAVREQMDTINVELAKTVTAATLAQTLARTELIKTAQGLLEKARKLAETGRPRLLAVISKIILDRHLQFNPKIPQPPRAAAPRTVQ
jgi:hypothetical protein